MKALVHLFHNLVHLGRKHKHDFNLKEHHREVVIFVPGFSLSSYAPGAFAKNKLEEMGCKAFAFNAGVNTRDICRTAERLGVFIEEVCAKTRVDKVSILAYSLGGLITLCYSFNFNGQHRLNKIITVATPFSGTRLAWLACPTTAGRQMLPGSSLLRQLNTGPKDFSNLVSIRARRDQVVKPQSSSFLTGAKNIEVPVDGHLTVMRAPETWAVIAKELNC